METLKKATMPIFKFFELTIDSKVEDEFKKIYVDNFKTSLKNKKGTLSMYFSYKKRK